MELGPVLERCCSVRFIALAGLLACGGGPDERGGSVDTLRVAQPTDSLVSATPSGTEIWFTLARAATSSDGTRCIERGIEIRRGTTRLKVPLLYTGSAPVLLNDSIMRASLWNGCIPGEAYLVDLRTGHPTRERAGGKP